MSLAQGAGLVLRLGSTLVLSRLLAPEVYGIVGPAQAVLMTLEWFSDLGIRPALVRDSQGGTAAYLQTGWWIGLIRGAFLAAIAVGLALPLADAYGQPDLAGILAALALLPVLQALRSPGQPVLRRELNFRALFVDEIGQIIVGTSVTLIVAWSTHSVWAIVAGTLAGTCASIVISYIQCPIRPAWIWDTTACHHLLRVSRQIVLNTFLMALLMNSDRLLGLKLVSLEQMSLYAVAWNLAAVLDSLLARACDVYFSTLSRIIDPIRRAALHNRVCLRVSAIAMPGLALGVGLAPSTIRLFYDVRYAGAGVLFALLVARLMLRTLGQIQFQYLLARAKIRIASLAYFGALLVQAAILIPLTQQWGGIGLAVAALVSTTVLTILQTAMLWLSGECKTTPLFLSIGWVLFGLFLLSLEV
jgi:O-antigen/teichoic acid export membrane protein